MAARLRHDALAALTLALVLSIVWTWRDWTQLSLLHLPDTDDAMRLQQIRDWLGGQRWSDLTQHRLGPPPGLPMHWSRLVDLGPGAIIALLTPGVGTSAAELTAVLLWPALLFAVALLLVARITHRLAASEAARTAMIVAALAYPATSVFLPGRIDHHNVQVVLLLAATLAVLRGGGRGMALAGVCVGTSLIVGLETMPALAILSAMVAAQWIASGERHTLPAFAAGLAVMLGIGRATFASAGFDYPACDGFTSAAFGTAMAAVAAAGTIGFAGYRITGRAARGILAAAVGVPVVTAALLHAPQCLSPYGAVTPVLDALWLSHVEEAQSVLTAAPATAIGYLGLAVIGLPATLYRVRRQPDAGWGIVTLLLAATLAIALVQLRGAYAAAMLAAPGLATMIGEARRRGGWQVAAAWLASAGMLYPLAADALTPRGGTTVSGDAIRGDCASAAAMRALRTLAPGTVLAPIDAGSWVLAATPHRVVAAPYHRNTAGNLVPFRFYAASPAVAAGIADRWHVDYVMACAGLPGAADPRSIAASLGRNPHDRAPASFVAVAVATDGATIFARDRLSSGAPSP
ncbi:hypothetical protein [Sphingomonas sp. CLY1604]|uniref:hypothetical protein n=1 Tax=Sphingomonas sp. CLY1604 TaxID=3457786 RepID=UPI003FD80138